MKITAKQLKQLIREQIEEAWSLGDGDYSTASTESQLAGWERDRIDKNNERAREESRYREQQQAAWSRENTLKNNADREQAEDRARAAASSQAAQAKKASAAAATKEATAKANKLLNVLNSEGVSNSLIKDGTDGYQLHFGVWMKNPELYNKKREAWNPDVLKALQNMTISNGPLKGQNAAEALAKAQSGDLEGPGLMSKVKGFFGMKEVRQLVREEVARQLRNKR